MSTKCPPELGAETIMNQNCSSCLHWADQNTRTKCLHDSFSCGCSVQADVFPLNKMRKMAPVNGDVKWRCVIVCAILSVLLFERTVCVYTYDRKDLLHILQTVNCEYRPKTLVLFR